ncbi:hypothetical protein ETB97_001150 [Aspergillus alliaceus]|uniref:Glycoside hydrolase family 3 N-terminal domain-containing protein n=1 Tax=Petromyces alliaceus TaxID=209559 RepID=A0A8H6EAZ8_PETAA|nr:hypothetical protein ETB97_001150 [Aspergillus burnettii]
MDWGVRPELRSTNNMGEHDLQRVLGNLFLIGFEGTVLTQELRGLIESHFVGAILLTSKNLKSGDQATHLISSLQWCAYAAGHERPLLIAIDQENGSLNSLVDESITQFPSAMGMAANGSPSLTRQVATASASELSCVGVNWILGPVLDVLSASRASPLGVRAFGDDPITVLTHGLETVHGFKKARVACCGKHFPSYGDVEFVDGTEFSLPSMATTMDSLRNRAFIPFQACAQAGLDAILVGGCTLNIDGKAVNHACLESSVVTDILRHECQFGGVVLSECLAMEALCQDIGISQGATMAIKAGCDMVMLCRTYQSQLEGLAAVKLAVQDGSVPLQVIMESNNRINAMKDGCTSWERALSPQGPVRLTSLSKDHLILSDQVYRGAISLVRDTVGNLLRIRNIPADKEVLLLTPLVGLFASTATRAVPKDLVAAPRVSRLAPGEDTFQSFGAFLAHQLRVRLIHTSYSSNGVRPVHEQLISRSSAVIILTADATRNTSQYGVTKLVNMQCRYQTYEGRQKPVVVVALSSPHDFLTDNDIHTYICTYDFTTPSLNNLALLLAGKLNSTKIPPLALARQASPNNLRRTNEPMNATWLVEPYDDIRDRSALERLWSRIPVTQLPSTLSPVDGFPGKKCFVVRNSTMMTILGIVVISIFESRPDGQIEIVLVDPDRKGFGIENSLHEHALSYLASVRSLSGVSISQPYYP